MTFSGKSLTKADEARRFDWTRVRTGEPSQCWPWIGSLNKSGYGHCVIDGRPMNASRAAFIDFNGPISTGLVVCHSCDNPACCNPAHLWAGTQAENLADCRAKGRQVYKRGGDHHRVNAKLSAEKVVEARRLYASGVSQSEIARRWGMNPSSISRAVRGEFWKHIK